VVAPRGVPRRLPIARLMHVNAEDRARAERAKGRAAWPGGLARLEELREVEPIAGSPEELFALVTELTLAAWAMRGVPLPDYPRDRAPGRIIRGR
jgi:hypothetical protein